MMRTILLRRRHSDVADPIVVDPHWRPWCTCPRPRWQRVVLFDAITLACHECAECGKPDRAELGRPL